MLKNLQNEQQGNIFGLELSHSFLLESMADFINAGIGFVIILFLHYVNRDELGQGQCHQSFSCFGLYTISLALTVFIINDKVDWLAGFTLSYWNRRSVAGFPAGFLSTRAMDL